MSTKERLALLVQLGVHDQIVEVCKRHHALVSRVLIRDNSKTVCRARDACVAFLRGLEMSYPEIAHLLGYGDHTSAMDAMKRHKKRQP